MIMDICKDLGWKEDKMNIFEGDCHHHLHNIIYKAVEKNLSRKLTQLLEADLEIILRHSRAKRNSINLTRLMDKEINLTVNYTKGHGDEF